jgi:peptide methionine sulfoxide reductase MsrB
MGSSNNSMRKNETKSDIACIHPSKSKRKKRKKIKDKKKTSHHEERTTYLCSPA